MPKKLLADYIKVYEQTLAPERCQALIDRFEASAGDHETQWIDNAYSFVQLNVSQLWPEVGAEILAILNRCLSHYQQALALGPFWPAQSQLENLRLKRYQPGGHDHFAPHVDTMDQGSCTRFCTAILYLNETQGGETVFPDLDAQVRPKPGRMVVFPPLWTYVHAGLPPRDRAKYTLQTYLLYPPARQAAPQ